MIGTRALHKGHDNYANIHHHSLLVPTGLGKKKGMGGLSRGPNTNIKPAKVIDEKPAKDSRPNRSQVIFTEDEMLEKAFGKKKKSKK